jgi:TPR repeat protein
MASAGGYINAHYRLGLLLESASPSEEERQKIISLYRMAGDKGCELAFFRLAQLYHHGANQDYAEAFRLYKLAAKQGYQPAQIATCVSSELVWKQKRVQLNDDLMPGELEYASCFGMWESVANQGNVDLQYNLGILFEETGIDSSLSEAATWYSRAVKSSHSLAVYRLGRLYETGRGVHQDDTKAIKYYQIASGLGNTDALYQLGIIYQYGKGTSPNANKAIVYYTQAAERGSTMAQFTLGQLFEEGTLFLKNTLEAVKWYSISRTQGNEKARNWLHNYYDESYISGSFYSRRFHILSQIIEFNDLNHRQNNKLVGEVNYKIGHMYLYGYGTEQNYKKALACFRMSTKLCNDDTARFFSEIAYKDIFALLTEEYLKKLDMFEAAVEQLDLEDIYELGLIYYHGVKCASKDIYTHEHKTIINPDHVRSSSYFKMIVKEKLSGKMSQQ